MIFLLRTLAAGEVCVLGNTPRLFLAVGGDKRCPKWRLELLPASPPHHPYPIHPLVRPGRSSLSRCGKLRNLATVSDRMYEPRVRAFWVISCLHRREPSLSYLAHWKFFSLPTSLCFTQKSLLAEVVSQCSSVPRVPTLPFLGYFPDERLPVGPWVADRWCRYCTAHASTQIFVFELKKKIFFIVHWYHWVSRRDGDSM